LDVTAPAETTPTQTATAAAAAIRNDSFRIGSLLRFVPNVT
jgi:hypothetical protein